MQRLPAYDQLASVEASLARIKKRSAHRILDLRSREEFKRRRLVCSHNIPQVELPQRLFELPPKRSAKPLAVIVPRAAASLPCNGSEEPPLQLPQWLDHHGWHCNEPLLDSDTLWQQAAVLGLLQTAAEPIQSTLLFEPCPLLQQHVAHFETALPPEMWTCLDVGAQMSQCGSLFGTVLGDIVHYLVVGQPAMLSLGCGLPGLYTSDYGNELQASSAKSAGCGSGRDLIYLASRGWKCTGLDNWKAAVRRATTAAANYGAQDHMRVQRMQIAADGSLAALPQPSVQSSDTLQPQTIAPPALASAPALPSRSPELGPSEDDAAVQERLQQQFGLVLNVRFLCRGLYPQLRRWVAPHGFLLFSTFLDPGPIAETSGTMVRNCAGAAVLLVYTV